MTRTMKRVAIALSWVIGAFCSVAFARGVTPYLPLNLEPEIERDIEHILILADKPVLTRPIPAAVLLDALPKACAVETPACKRVRRFLARYMHDAGITYASAQAAVSRGAKNVTPNQHGLDTQDHWQLDGQAYYQPGDYALVSVGGIAYSGRTTPTGSMLSLGFDRAQLDIGYRDHWWSPMTDSAMVISTEAPTMPSVTLSNTLPFTSLGLEYEMFLARMSESDRILFKGHLTSGKPLFAGFHLQMEPVSGWAFGLNRILQYGGGGYGGTSIQELLRAFFEPGAAQQPGANPATNNTAFGNQEASVTSRFIFPGKVPFSVYFEYAGEDTSRGRSYLLGNVSLSAGIHFPRIADRFDVTYEISDWQNGWYVHDVYLDGLVNYGRVTGNWFGDQRQFGDGVGGQSNMLKVGWEPSFGGLLETQFRTLANDSYSSVPYHHENEVMLSYSHPWQSSMVGGDLIAGRDVFGQRFTELAGFVRYGNKAADESAEAAEDTEEDTSQDAGANIFVDVGANANRVLVDLSDTIPRTDTKLAVGPHLGIGARRAVSDHSDLGVRLELDDINQHALTSVRLIDYRYRFTGPLALSAFLGASRYALATPAYGFLIGAGVQYRNLLPGWDLDLDYRDGVKVARDHLLASDPTGTRPDSFYDVTSVSLYLSHRF